MSITLRAGRAPRRAALGLLLAAGSALLAACSGSLLPKPAALPARFTLDGGGPAPAARALGAGAPVLAVDVPRAAPGYDSARMLYVRRPPQLEAFAFHEWVEVPARMLAPQLVRALQDSGGFRAVLEAPSGGAATWRLETELLRLHQDFTRQPSRIRLTLRAVLLDGATRQPVAWREFDVAVPAAADDPVSGAQAAQAAVQELAAAVAAFCAQQVAQAARAPR